MSKLPVVNYRKMHILLSSLGFEIIRQKGSHVRYIHLDGRLCTVPNHGSKDLLRPLIRAILRDIKLTPEEYQELLDNLK
jgi:predicted RNA binding protein YcfA (HicA-like mRNA interferase family)